MFCVKLKYVRLSYAKGLSVANKIRGKDVVSVLNVLEFSVKKSSRLIRKLLLSAIANVRNKGYNPDNFYISEIFFNHASFLKRLRMCAKGRSSRILKRCSHLTIKLSKKN